MNTRIPNRLVNEPTIRYSLLFWSEEQKYELLLSSSSIFKSTTDKRALGVGDEVTLRNGSVPMIIACGYEKSKIEKCLDRLESKLRRGKRASMENSFGFFDTSVTTDTSQEPDEGFNNDHSQAQTSTSSTQMDCSYSDTEQVFAPNLT